MSDNSAYGLAKMLVGLDRGELDVALDDLNECYFQPIAQTHAAKTQYKKRWMNSSRRRRFRVRQFPMIDTSRLARILPRGKRTLMQMLKCADSKIRAGLGHLVTIPLRQLPRARPCPQSEGHFPAPTATFSPSWISPARINPAKGSCTFFWMTRFKGRAP